MTYKRLLVFVVTILFMFFITACSPQTAEDTVVTEGTVTDSKVMDTEEIVHSDNNEPVTIRLGTLLDEEWSFTNRIKIPVEEKFPHITLEYFNVNPADTESIEQMNAKLNPTGEVVDIFFMPNPSNVTVLREFDLEMSLDTLIDQHNSDLSHIHSSVLESIRNIGHGELHSFPADRAPGVLHYNKEVFDSFGEDYPTDNMTWDEVIELAKRTTGERHGNHYRGLSLDGWIQVALLWMLDEDLVDPETLDVKIENNDQVRRWLNMLHNIMSIPGMFEPGEEFNSTDAPQEFTQGSVAMMPLWGNWGLIGQDMEVDFVSYPTWPETPGVGLQGLGWAYSLNPYSEVLDEAYHVLEYLASEEYQILQARKFTIVPTLSDPDLVNENFGAENEDVIARLEQGDTFNFAASAVLTPHPGPSVVSKYDTGIDWGQVPKQFAESGLDVVSFMRQLQEEAEANVQEQLGRE